MEINLSIEDITRYLYQMGYSDKDIYFMLKEPYYTVLKNQLEAYISTHQKATIANNKVDPLETIKHRQVLRYFFVLFTREIC